MKRIGAYFRLTRPLNMVIGAIGIVLGGHLTGNLHVGSSLWLAIVTAMSMTGGANAINDYYDYDIDRINKPHRPLPAGLIPRNHARLFAYVLFGVGIITSAIIGFDLLLIAAVSVLLLIGYSRWWKRQPIVGNIVVSLMIAVAFLYGAAAFGNAWAALPPAYMGFLFTWGREIIKDLEDMQADTEGSAYTLPVRFGEISAKILTTVLFIFLVIGLFIPYVINIYNLVYFIVVLVGVSFPIFYIIIRLWQAKSPAEFRFLSQMLKADMLVGLFAVFVGTF